MAKPMGTTQELLAGESGKCCKPPVKKPRPIEAIMPIASRLVQVWFFSGLAIFSKIPLKR
jgi:hypothetical protein